jgi:hypothetical protein
MTFVPLIIKFGIPLAAYGIGHVVGWFHHKHVTEQNIMNPAVKNG